MAERESLNLRVQQELREHVADIASEVEGADNSRAISSVAEHLIYLGLGMKRADNDSESSVLPTIEGPFGVLPRPWAEPSFGGGDIRLATRIDSPVVNQLEQTFNKTKHTAAKQALRLGVILINKDDIKMRGPVGVERPFSRIALEENLRGERARTALETLTPARRSS